MRGGGVLVVVAFTVSYNDVAERVVRRSLSGPAGGHRA